MTDSILKKMLDRFHTYYLRQRFFPNWFSVFINPFYFIRKRLIEKVRRLAPQLEGELLDFGCGAKPYQELFPHLRSYLGVDIENEGHNHKTEEIDVYYDGVRLPFNDNSFDAILTSEVLEHVPNVDGCLTDLVRVLRPGGKMLVTVPFIWAEHELPYDFRRFSLIGIRKHITDQGLTILAEERSGHFAEVVLQLWMAYLRSLFYVKNKYVNLLMNAIFIAPVCILGGAIVWLLPRKPELYFNTIILAQKEI